MKRRLPIDELNERLPKDSRLRAVEYIKETIPFSGTKRTAAIFRCSCGKELTHSVTSVRRGIIKSCGCLMAEGNYNRKYYYQSEKLRRAYYTMIGRCHIPTDTMYKWYGARGVVVCDEWRTNPQAFFDWAHENGFGENLSLDKDIKGNGMLYSPDTCCWVPQSENIKHTRRARWAVFEGKRMVFSDINRAIGCSHGYVSEWSKKGLTPDQIKEKYLAFKERQGH